MAINKQNNENYYKRVFTKKCEYNGMEFDSQMEMHFAMFLDGQIVNYKGACYYHKPVKYERESKSFELIEQEPWIDRTERDMSVKRLVRNKKHTLQRVIYTPDFYLPEHDLYIEIKGFQHYDSLYKLRLRLFRHFYPNEKLWLILHHEDFMQLDKILENIKIGE